MDLLSGFQRRSVVSFRLEFIKKRGLRDAFGADLIVVGFATGTE
jgi:hypothetical protein